MAVLIDDAHLMPMECLRRLRLLLEEFPRSHNVVLFSQAEMLRTLRLTVNQDLHSRLTYSATLRKLAPDAVETFVLAQFDRCGLPHNTLASESLALIARSSDGVLRSARNLTLATLIETVRAGKKQAGSSRFNSRGGSTLLARLHSARNSYGSSHSSPLAPGLLRAVKRAPGATLTNQHPSREAGGCVTPQPRH